MRDLGANVLRIHLQTAVFMSSPNDVNAEAIAEVVAGQPAVFCYDLMNEPILTGGDDPGEWLPGGGLGNFHFVQRITRDLNGRTRKEVARDWVDTHVEAMRREDPDALITVGVIPWVFHWEGRTPLFYSDEVGEYLDFASVHFYPRHGEIDKALKALAAYDVGKPLVIEETAPLHCSIDELAQFIDRSRSIADGWIGFFWGKTSITMPGKPAPSTKSHTAIGTTRIGSLIS